MWPDVLANGREKRSKCSKFKISSNRIYFKKTEINATDTLENFGIPQRRFSIGPSVFIELR